MTILKIDILQVNNTESFGSTKNIFPKMAFLSLYNSKKGLFEQYLQYPKPNFLFKIFYQCFVCIGLRKCFLNYHLN